MAVNAFYLHGIITLYISTFQFDGQDPTKDGTGLDRSSSDFTDMSNTGLVVIFTADDRWAMSNTTKSTGYPQPPTQTRSKIRLTKMRLKVFRLSGRHYNAKVYRERLRMSSSLHGEIPPSDSTTVVSNNVCFCGRHINPIKPTVNDILVYLDTIHQKGLKFSAFQTARGAVNNFVRFCGGSDFSSHFLIKRNMQGDFNMKPSLPKYDSVWDVQLVLR